jgi:threonyl-tRNA synthetase
MYTLQIDEEDCAVKPMNCPGGMLVYGETPKSFRELPLRVGELGHVHRHEKSGVLDGLRRVRAFTQDDAHIFMTPEQISDEIYGVIDLADTIYSVFGLEYDLFLSTRPEKSIGSDENWAKAEAGLRDALDRWGKPYEVNEGDGAFYGPKIDFMLQDALGRKHQCGTIQLDMSLPERFDLTYIGPDNAAHRVVMIHRALYGSLDRFMGILIEHFAGAFPFWLAPTQARILPITDEFNDYAFDLQDKLIEAGFRADVNDKSDKIGKKIRDAAPMKIPYLLVVGKKEAEAGMAAPRLRDGTELPAMSIADLLARMTAENDPFADKQPRWRFQQRTKSA